MARRPVSILPTARRYEAAGFRAWPAATVRYDGAWLVRLTPGFNSNRLNSVNVLDPGDVADIPGRVRRAAGDFAALGKPPVFRLTPLVGREVADFLDREGWEVFGSSLVMRAPLKALPLDEAVDQISLKDAERFARDSFRVHGESEEASLGLAEVIRAIPTEPGLFVVGDEASPVATVICVQEGDIAGIFNLATRSSERGKGHGRRAVLSALRWARHRGARTAWLQVEEDNAAAVSLYRSLGFTDIYRYSYRRQKA